MTEAVVFETPGLLDLNAVTTFGINVKKGLNPIGYFGTGLKYAIAVLIREGLRVTIYVGPKEYDFYKKIGDFRDKEFEFVMMRQRNSLIGRWTTKQMPFTTEFGKNWELWQAFRELESNTRDEGGHTYTNYLNNLGVEIGGGEGLTRIVVEGQAFRNVWEKRNEIFLPEGQTVYYSTDSIQVFKAPSRNVYYRGLKVMELPEDRPAKLTYNILAPVQLTEDRTVKYDWELRDRIMTYIACSCTDMQIMNEVITADEKTTWEGSFPFDQLWQNPSEAFMGIIRKKRLRAADRAVAASYVAPRVTRLYESRLPVEPPPEPMRLRKDLVGERATQAINELASWLMRFSAMFDYDNASDADARRVALDILELKTSDVEVVMVSKATTPVDIGDDIPF